MERIIYTNGAIYTLDANQPLVEAVVVENGQVADMGTHQKMILHWGGSGAKIIDLEGKMATPGLIDSHLHLSGIAFQYLDLNLTGVASKEDMLERIKERADKTPPGKWLLGMGWDENLFIAAVCSWRLSMGARQAWKTESAVFICMAIIAISWSVMRRRVRCPGRAGRSFAGHSRRSDETGACAIT